MELNRLYNVKLHVFKSSVERTYNSDNENIYHPKGLLSIYGGYRTGNLSNGGAQKVLVLYGKCVKNIAVPYGSQAEKVFVPYMKHMQLVIAYCSWGSGGTVSLPVVPGQCPGGLLKSFRVKFESKIKFNLNILRMHFLWVFPGIDMF